MSFKKKLKKIVKNAAKDSAIFGDAYQDAIELKRRNRYEKYANQPVDRKLLVFEAFMGRKYTDSPKAIYEYLLSDEAYSEYHFVWCFRDSVMSEMKCLGDNPRTELVRWGSEEYYETYATAGYWITNTRIPKAIGIRDGQKYVQCWHGTPLKRLGCDIETEATEPKEVTRQVIHGDADRYSYFLSPSPFYSQVMTSAFDLENLGNADVIIETGYPRNDAIVNHSEADVAKVKETLGIPDCKKVILYAPTYRENQRNSEKQYTYKEPLKFDELKRKFGEEYVILFRAHYFIAQEFDFNLYNDFVIDVSAYPEINDLYIVSDLLITDYSSVFFDFSILQRPILFYMYDLEFYRDELRGFYLTIDELPGPIIETQEELEKRIADCEEWSSKDEYKRILREFKKRFAPWDDGHATERVVKTVIGEDN